MNASEMKSESVKEASDEKEAKKRKKINKIIDKKECQD